MKGHRMKKILLVGIATVSICGQPAIAADASAKAVAPHRFDALLNWRGFYVGAHGGYGWGHADWAVTADGFGFLQPRGLPVEITGGLVGVQIGYNLQQGAWIYGLESDFSFSALKGFSFTELDDDGYRTELSNFGTLRGRLGITTGATLWYVTAGAAFGRFKSTVGDLAPLAFDPNDSASDGMKKWGIVVGAGGEWPFAPNWVLRTEYFYVDLGKIRFSSVAPRTGNPVRANIDTAFSFVRVGVNYRW
jgi:outer membrane immunogenic protein